MGSRAASGWLCHDMTKAHENLRWKLLKSSQKPRPACCAHVATKQKSIKSCHKTSPKNFRDMLNLHIHKLRSSLNWQLFCHRLALLVCACASTARNTLFIICLSMLMIIEMKSIFLLSRESEDEQRSLSASLARDAFLFSPARLTSDKTKRIYDENRKKEQNWLCRFHATKPR